MVQMPERPAWWDEPPSSPDPVRPLATQDVADSEFAPGERIEGGIPTSKERAAQREAEGLAPRATESYVGTMMDAKPPSPEEAEAEKPGMFRRLLSRIKGNKPSAPEPAPTPPPPEPEPTPALVRQSRLDELHPDPEPTPTPALVRQSRLPKPVSQHEGITTGAGPPPPDPTFDVTEGAGAPSANEQIQLDPENALGDLEMPEEAGGVGEALEGIEDSLDPEPEGGGQPGGEGDEVLEEQREKKKADATDNVTQGLSKFDGILQKLGGLFGPLGSEIGRLAGNLIKLEAASIGFIAGVEGMGDAALDAQEHLRQFSGHMNDLFARMEVQEIQLAQESAQRTGGTTTAMGKQLMELKEEFQPIKDALINVKNFVLMILIILARMLTFLVKVFGILFHIGRILEWIFGGAAESDAPGQEYMNMIRDVSSGSWGSPHMRMPGAP